MLKAALGSKGTIVPHIGYGADELTRPGTFRGGTLLA